MKRETTRLIKLLKEKKLTLALGESMTCGLAAHQLNTVKGTMDVFKGGLVCYHPETKIDLLGISKKMIDTYTAESKEVTNAIARALPKFFQADVFGSITGLAAAGGSETKTKPVGTVFLAVYDGQKIFSERKRFYGRPMEVRKKACEALYAFIRSVLTKNGRGHVATTTAGTSKKKTRARNQHHIRQKSDRNDHP